jgi:hypothetical protein
MEAIWEFLQRLIIIPIPLLIPSIAPIPIPIPFAWLSAIWEWIIALFV